MGVVGPQEYLAERAISDTVKQVRRHDTDSETHSVDASEPGFAGDFAQAVSPSLFGGALIVIVNAAEHIDPAAMPGIIEQAQSTPDGSAIIFRHAGGAKGKKIVAALEQSGTVVRCDDIKRGRALTDFAVGEFHRHKKKIVPEAVALLLAAVGSDVRSVAAAAEQLSADIEQPAITTDDIRTYFGSLEAVTGFQLSDAVLNRDPVEVLRLIRMATVHDPQRFGPAAVGSVASSLRQLTLIASAPPGVSDRDLAAEAGVPPWKVSALKAQARRWRPRGLARAILELARLDAAVKGGLRPGEQLDAAQKGWELESVMIDIARGRPATD